MDKIKAIWESVKTACVKAFNVVWAFIKKYAPIVWNKICEGAVKLWKKIKELALLAWNKGKQLTAKLSKLDEIGDSKAVTMLMLSLLLNIILLLVVIF